MKNDYELIVHKFPIEQDSVRIYPIGDLHRGSSHMNDGLFQKWKEKVKSDPNGYVVFIGDMLDIGLKNSKTNCYQSELSPAEEKERLFHDFKDIPDKILGAVKGNHCDRITQATGECPLYDVMCRLRREDMYRENMAFIKINLGFKNKTRQYSYVLGLHHGGSKNKVHNFGYTIDGLDVFITGHTHDPSCDFPSKIVVDTKNECVRLADFTHLVVPSYQEFGGYAIRGMYTPKASNIIPIIELSGTEKKVKLTWERI